MLPILVKQLNFKITRRIARVIFITFAVLFFLVGAISEAPPALACYTIPGLKAWSKCTCYDVDYDYTDEWGNVWCDNKTYKESSSCDDPVFCPNSDNQDDLPSGCWEDWECGNDWVECEIKPDYCTNCTTYDNDPPDTPEPVGPMGCATGPDFILDGGNYFDPDGMASCDMTNKVTPPDCGNTFSKSEFQLLEWDVDDSVWVSIVPSQVFSPGEETFDVGPTGEDLIEIGKQYKWRVRYNDGCTVATSWGGWSPWIPFTANQNMVADYILSPRTYGDIDFTLTATDNSYIASNVPPIAFPKLTPVVLWEWDFDFAACSVADIVGAGNDGNVQQCTYTVPGFYHLTLKTTDACDDVGLKATDLEVRNPPQITSFNSNPVDGTQLFFGDTVTFDFSATDPEGNWGQPPRAADGGGDPPGWWLKVNIDGTDCTGNYCDSLEKKGDGTTGNIWAQTFVNQSEAGVTISMDPNILTVPPTVVTVCLWVYDDYYGTDSECKVYTAGCRLVKNDPFFVDPAVAGLHYPIPPRDGVEVFNVADPLTRNATIFEPGVADNWGWEPCIGPLAQQRRYVAKRGWDCKWDFVWEVRSGFPDLACKVQPPALSAAKPIIRSEIYGDKYQDLFSNPPTVADKAAGRASFGPLYSIMLISGDNFYNFGAVPLTPLPTLDRLTHTEVWMSGYKLAGISNKINEIEPFVKMPNCVIPGPPPTNCEMEVQVNSYQDPLQRVPECSNTVDVAGVVDQIVYSTNGINWQEVMPDVKEWDNGENDDYWIVPSTLRDTVEDTDPQDKIIPGALITPNPDGAGLPPWEMVEDVTFRGARFTFERADQQVNSTLQQCSQPDAFNKAPVGYPLSLTMEYDYTDRDDGTPRIAAPRSCAIPGVSDFCGFGREHMPATREQFFTRVAFYSSADQVTRDDFDRMNADLEDPVDLYEPGKPWNKFKIFPLVTDLDPAVAQATMRVYSCGSTVPFMESGNAQNPLGPNKYKRFTEKEVFELSYQPFGISRVGPIWGNNTAGNSPLFWGHDFKPPAAAAMPAVTATVKTWDGIKPLNVTIGTSQQLSISLLSDNLQPQGTALGEIKMCRKNTACCQEILQDVYKENYHPAGERAPQITSVDPPDNWQAQSFKIYEDIPYRENYCLNQDIVIKSVDKKFGPATGLARLWATDVHNWLPAEVIAWNTSQITIRASGVATGKSPDCGGAPFTLGEVSNLTLPARIQTATQTLILDQDKIYALPPRRLRLVTDPAPAEKDNYCLNDRISITGATGAFGWERLGAHIDLGGQAVSRYLKWSDREIVVTPPAIYSGRRSPFCERTGDFQTDGLLSTIKTTNAASFVVCPDPLASRTCLINSVNLIAPYGAPQPVPVYHYLPNFRYFNNLCAYDEIEITGGPFGSTKGNNLVEFWSPTDGWQAAGRYLSWADNKIILELPQVYQAGLTSPDCPRKSPSSSTKKEVSIMDEAMRIRINGAYIYLSVYSASVKVNTLAGFQALAPATIRLYKDTELTNKQYGVGEMVTIKGKNFADIRSESEGVRYNIPDRRNTGFVEFFSEEIGWVPAFINMWQDNQITVQAPAISFEDDASGGVSVAGQPVRVCTYRGCSTNLLSVAEPEVLQLTPATPCSILWGVHLGDAVASGFGAYKNGSWWKEPSSLTILSDRQVRICPQAIDGMLNTAQYIRYCRNTDDRCILWDVAAKKSVNWHVPEPKTFTPYCVVAVPGATATASLVTVYGEDFDYAYDTGEFIIVNARVKLNDGAGTTFNLNIHNPPGLFREQYRDRLVLQIATATAQAIGALIPLPADPKGLERQVITGKIILLSKFFDQGQNEVPGTITFGNYCESDNQCIAGHAPFIKSVESTYVGEDINKNINSIRVGGADLAIGSGTAQIFGCNFTDTAGASAYFGDVLQYQPLSPMDDWYNFLITLTTPFGAKSGFMSANVWTGLLEYPGPYLDTSVNLSQHPRLTKDYNVLPTIEAVQDSLGPADQMSDIFGSDFCGPGGCTNIFSRLAVGVWQDTLSPSPDIPGARAQVFDITPRHIVIKIPEEENYIRTYADAKDNVDRLAISGQVLMTRADRVTSQPFVSVAIAGFNPVAFAEAKNYYHKTPVLRETDPRDIERKDLPIFKGVDYYGDEVSPFNLLIRYHSYLPSVEFVRDTIYELENLDLIKRQFAYPDWLSLKTTTIKRVPDAYYDYSGAGEYYVNNSQGVILSNWDDLFSYWLGQSFSSEQASQRAVYKITDVKETTGYSHQELSEPGESELAQTVPSYASAIEVKRISPLPLLDLGGNFCAGQAITIEAVTSSRSFFNKRYPAIPPPVPPPAASTGTVYLWSDTGWEAAKVLVWQDMNIVIRPQNAQTTKHPDCPGASQLIATGRLPIKICRYLKAPDVIPECVIYDPKTHLKLSFASGEVPPYRTTSYGRYNRLNIEPTLIHAGDNLIDDVYVDSDYFSGLYPDTGLVEIFINKLSNDYKTDIMDNNLYVNIANTFYSPLGRPTRDNGLIWIKEEANNKLPGKYDYSTAYYDGSERYLACLDAACTKTGMLAPEHEPAIGSPMSGATITALRFLSYGMIQESAVYLVPDLPTVGNMQVSGKTIVITGTNFYNSKVNIDGKLYNANSACLKHISNTQLVIDLARSGCTLRERPNNLHAIRIYNENYGAVNPGWSLQKTFKIKLPL